MSESKQSFELSRGPAKFGVHVSDGAGLAIVVFLLGFFVSSTAILVSASCYWSSAWEKVSIQKTAMENGYYEQSIGYGRTVWVKDEKQIPMEQMAAEKWDREHSNARQ